MENTQKKSSKGLTFIIVLLILSGIALIAYGIYDTSDYWQKNFTYDSISAEVIDHKYNSEGLVAIIVEYSVGEKTYTIESETYSKNPVRKRNTVLVKYDPQNPNDSIISEDSEKLKLPIIGGSLILGAIIISIIKRIIRKAKPTVPATKPTIEETKTQNTTTQTTAVEQPLTTLENSQPTETFNANIPTDLAKEETTPIAKEQPVPPTTQTATQNQTVEKNAASSTPPQTPSSSPDNTDIEVFDI